jgi:hypothetical protein
MESGISGVAITLTGTDDLGRPVSRSLQSDGDGAYANISGRSCPPNSMIVSAGIFKRLAASRIASALGASYRQ